MLGLLVGPTATSVGMTWPLELVAEIGEVVFLSDSFGERTTTGGVISGATAALEVPVNLTETPVETS